MAIIYLILNRINYSYLWIFKFYVEDFHCRDFNGAGVGMEMGIVNKINNPEILEIKTPFNLFRTKVKFI
jgi:hypothetical protein